jgi:hypothetical protein
MPTTVRRRLPPWHHAADDDGPIDGRRLAGRPDGGYAVAEIADFVADLTLRGLLADPDDLDRVRRAAAQ